MDRDLNTARKEPFTEADFEALQACPQSLLHGASKEAVLGLLSMACTRRLESGVVYSRGEDEAMLLVLSGRLMRHPESPPERGAVYARGDAYGELSILGGRDDSSVLALEPARVLCVGPAVFWCLARASHEFSYNLLLLLTRRVEASQESLARAMRLQAQLEEAATTDALTGLRNRRWFNETLPRIIRRHQFNRAPMSLLMVDADRFKRINDTYGHAAGDDCLREIAKCTRTYLRPLDVASRYGGEEIAVVLPETPAAGAVVAAERLRTAVERSPVALAAGGAVHVTVSVGVAELADGEDAVDLIVRADRSLYRAKSSGRNRVVCYELTEKDGEAAREQVPRPRKNFA